MAKLEPIELKAREYMEELFVPSLHSILENANPLVYRMWNGNACRQTAILGVKFLESLLPHYRWTAWDGDFTDVYNNNRRVTYNHAWIFGTHKDRKLLVDLSRVNKERLFIVVNKNAYPSNHREYKDMRLIKKIQLNIDEQLKSYEYYTGLRGEELLKLLADRIEVMSHEL